MRIKTSVNLPVLILAVTIIPFLTSLMPETFREEQKKFSRVKTAYAEKEAVVKEIFSSKGIQLNKAQIFIRAFKKEQELELWGRSGSEGEFLLVKTYKICASSGSPGPKRKQGDGQVPEGFYEIDRFNPNSNFYLSLGVSYPNASDRILGEKGNLGGDIFVHGNCVTIGCMPLTDDKIKEVYLAAVEAHTNGQKRISIHIFPFRMNDDSMRSECAIHSKNQELVNFWKEIKTGYDLFEKNMIVPGFKVGSKGEYIFE